VDSLRVAVKFAEEEEAEYTVWQELCDNLRTLEELYRSEPFYPNFQKMLLHIYKKQMIALGWEEDPEESPRTATLRSTVLRMLGIAEDDDVINESYRRFKAYMEHPDETTNMSGDLRQVIFRNSLRKNEEEVYITLKMHYERSTFPEEQRNCLTAMSCVRDMDRHRDMLEYVLFSGQVRDQDIAFPLNALVTSSDEGGRACWNTLKNDFEKLQSEFSGGGPVWGTMIGLMCRGLRTSEEADEVEAFFSDPDHSPSSGRMRLSQALEVVRVKAKRLERNKDQIAEFLLAEFP
jgi:aminopeptidase 2